MSVSPLTSGFLLVVLRASALVAGTFALGACDTDSSSEAAVRARTVPLPDLERAREAPVREAILAARDAVERVPGSAEAWGRYGELLAAHKCRPEALACFRAARELDGDAFRWPYLEALALVAVDPVEAVEPLERALAIDADYAPAHVHAGRLCEELGRRGDALRHARRAVELDPRSVDAALCLGQLLLLDGDPAGARRALDAALALDPEHPEVHSGLARACFAAGDVAASERHADFARRHAGRAGRSMDDPRARPRASATGSASRTSVADAHLAAGRLTEAVRAYRDALALRADLEPARRGLAVALERSGRAAEAIEVLEEGLELSPRASALRRELARMLEAAGRPEQAEVHLRRAVELRPGDVELLTALGRVVLARGRVEEAEARFREAIERDPSATAPLFGLARARLARSDPEGALDAFGAVLALEPENVRAWHDQGTVLARLRRAGPAREAFRNAHRALPDDAGIRRNLAGACVLFATTLPPARDAEAIASLEEAVSARGDWGPALAHLALRLATAPDPSLRNGERALGLARRAREGVDAPAALAAWAEAAALGELGRFEEAVARAEGALEQAERAGSVGEAEAIERALGELRAGRPVRR